MADIMNERRQKRTKLIAEQKSLALKPELTPAQQKRWNQIKSELDAIDGAERIEKERKDIRDQMEQQKVADRENYKPDPDYWADKVF